ncbi:MAG TPA: hypothetical protein DIW64_10760 [Cellvibrio sp.]|nr:hypothetical protein [Cellvibrio sp.]
MATTTNTSIPQQIRLNSLCGQCQSSTLIGWPDEDVDRDELPRGAVLDQETKSWYLVRCDYFRFTVPHPDQMSFCDAFKKREPKVNAV